MRYGLDCLRDPRHGLTDEIAHAHNFAAHEGAEARRVLRAVEAGRAVTNPKAKAFASEIVAELRDKSRLGSRRAY